VDGAEDPADEAEAVDVVLVGGDGSATLGRQQLSSLVCYFIVRKPRPCS
jgi:hypothetical protein